MIVLRFVRDVVLAIVVTVLVALLLVGGYGLAMSYVWESRAIGDGVTVGEWQWLDHQPIYYRTWGPDLGTEKGPVVVLVHGRQVEGLETWVMNAESLGRRGMRVIAIDLKGFGHTIRDASPSTHTLPSQADLLARMLNEFHVFEATVVGHGRGAAVAMQLALDQPQFVSRLVLIAPRHFDNAPPLERRIAEIPVVGRAAAWSLSSGGSLWRVYESRSFYDPSALDTAYWKQIRRPTRIEGTVDSLVAFATTLPDSDLPASADGIDVPTLILLGENDVYVTAEVGRQMTALMPDAELRIIPEAGHYVHIEQSSIVNELIRAFAQ